MAELEFSEQLPAQGFTSWRSRTRTRDAPVPFTALTIAGALVCVVAVSVVAASVPSDQAFGRGLVELLIVGAPIAAGLYVLRSSANTRFAYALIWIGFVWSVTAFTESSESIPYTVARIWTWVTLPSAVYLLLTFPGGRFARGFDRAVFWGFIAVLLVLFVGTAPLVQAFPPKTLWTTCTTDCPANAVFVLDHQPAFLTQLILVREWLIELLWLGLGWSMLRRWRLASPLQRRAVAPVFLAGGALMVFQFAHITYRQLGGSTDRVIALSSAWTLSIAALCATFPVGLFWQRRLLGRTLTRLGPTLRESESPSTVRDALSVALGDPDLELLFHDGGDGWHEASGRSRSWPQTLPKGRSATLISGEGDAEDVVLIHDEMLREDQELLDGVAGIVLAVRRHQQLATSLEQATRDLGNSRRRIAEAADQERARIERDLHDGAQQRLLAVSMKLARAEQRIQTDPDAASAELGRLSLELDLAMSELRSLAAGVYSPVLADSGISAALKNLCLLSPVPVHISDDGVERHPMEVESAVYFTIAEAVQNATKHATGSSGIWIRLSEASGGLRFEIRDDGFGMARDAVPGDGLQNMRDRIEAIGGRVAIDSEPGRGTRVTASVPLADE